MDKEPEKRVFYKVSAIPTPCFVTSKKDLAEAVMHLLIHKGYGCGMEEVEY